MSGFRTLQLILMILLAGTVTSNASTASSTRGVLTIEDYSMYAYACEILNFGTEGFYPKAILLRPSEESQLCEPSRTTGSGDTLNETLAANFLPPIGLMVSLGGCDIQQKIQNVLDMKETFSAPIKYIIFFNNDPDNNDGIVPISLPEDKSEVSLTEKVGSLTILSISTSAGVNIMGLIQKYSEEIGMMPELSREIVWDLRMIVRRVGPLNPQPLNPYSSSDSSGVNNANFYWFRLILFALLIMSPCCRGAYLWWNGGGRIFFRRNERGRIIGLQYIPPASYWFASTGAHDTSTPISDRLTEEQVMALPEVLYKGSDDTEEMNGLDSDQNENDEIPHLEDVDIVIGSGSADEDEENSNRDQTTAERVPSISESNRSSDEEKIDYSEVGSSFTTCSICIEEFEAGERLRLLPRCKHVFHTECILPWLTERQGCCPLCKSSVIERESDGGSNADEDEGPTQSQALEQDEDSARESQTARQTTVVIAATSEEGDNVTESNAQGSNISPADIPSSSSSTRIDSFTSTQQNRGGGDALNAGNSESNRTTSS